MPPNITEILLSLAAVLSGLYMIISTLSASMLEKEISGPDKANFYWSEVPLRYVCGFAVLLLGCMALCAALHEALFSA